MSKSSGADDNKPIDRDLQTRIDDYERRISGLEARLFESEERFRQMFDHHSSVRLLIDPGQDGLIVDANESACRFYGYKYGDLVGMKISQINIFSPDRVREEMEKASREKRSHFFFQHRLASGEIRDVEVHSSPAKIKGKQLLFSIIHDITQRVQAEKSLRESEERFRLLSDVTSEGVLIVVGGQIVDANSAALVLFEYDSDEMSSIRVVDLTLPGHPTLLDHPGGLNAAFTPMETICLKKSGRIFQAEVRERSIEYHGKKFQIIAIRDVSEGLRMQVALEEIERKYSVMVNTAGEGFWLLDENSITVEVNDSLSRLIGYPRDEIIGRYPKDFVAPAFESILIDDLIRAPEAKRRCYELAIRNKKGIEIPVIVNATSIRNSSGEYIGSFAFLTDISEIRRSQAVIQENLNLLQSIIDAIPAPVYFRDRSGLFKGVNRKFESVFNLSREAVLNHTPEQTLDSKNAEKLSNYFNEVLTGNKPVSFSASFTLAPDRKKDFIIFKSPYHNAAGEVSGVVGVALDITEQKIIEEQIRILNEHLEERVEEEINSRLKSEKKYEFLFNSSGDAMIIYLFDEDGLPGNILEVNDRAIEMLGYDRDEMKSMTPLNLMSRETLPFVPDLMHRISKGGSVFFEMDMRKKDGDLISAEVNTRLLYMDNRPMVFAVIRDITERKLLEHEKIVTNEMLIQQSKLAELGEMVGAIAHQWKQPLNVIGMMIQDMEEAWTVGEVNARFIKDFVKNSMEQIQFLIQTIDDFRRFFKSDHEEGFFRLDIAIRDTVRLVSTQMKNHDIEIHLDLAGAEQLKTFGTANELKQVILNLLNNSRDAINLKRETVGPRYHGEIWIKAYAEGDHAAMEFCDNGGGIPEKIMPELFNPYVTSKSDRGGTGIGLYMSRNLIERKFHGTINAWNGIAGACFRIELRRHTTAGSA